MSDRVCIDSDYGKFLVNKKEYYHFSRNYNYMFFILMEQLKNKEKIKTIIFDYDDKIGGNTILIYTIRGTLFCVDSIFEKDHENDTLVLGKLINTWNSLPEIESEKEQYSGYWEPEKKTIQFNRVFGSHRFSDEECEKLLQGEKLDFKAIAKTGKNITFSGYLEEQEYKGFRYFGFKHRF